MTSHRCPSQQRGDPLPRGMGPTGWDQMGALGTVGGGLSAVAPAGGFHSPQFSWSWQLGVCAPAPAVWVVEAALILPGTLTPPSAFRQPFLRGPTLTT